jgi:integrase
VKLKLPYVIERRAKGRSYFYFRSGVDREGRGGKLVRLPGVPGTREFSERYEQLLAEHRPKVLQGTRGKEAPATLGWVIEQFCREENKTTSPWFGLKPSTQAVYRRHFDWLREHYGDLLLASFDKELIRRIRNLRKANPSVANVTVDKIGQLWTWADEYADIALPGKNPAHEVAALKYESEAAPAWPQPLCAAFESCDHPRMVTFYFLALYTGQRKGDCCNMRWTDFDGRRIHVVQEKTGTKLWVPAHIRLRNYLASLPRESEFVLTSPKGTAYRKTSVTNLVCDITADLGFKGYSPHGLRHLAGAALAEAGCSVPQIMAVLGHITEKQAIHYVKQANRIRLGDDAMAIWERADERDNVIPLHVDVVGTGSEQSATELEKRTGKNVAK